MLLKHLLLFAISIVISQPVESSKILGVFWTPSRSHHILGSALLQALAKKGHDVTLLTPFVDDVDIPNFKQKKLEGIVGAGSSISNPSASFYKKLLDFLSTCSTNEKFWENEPVQELLKSKNQFDVIISVNFMSDGILALNHHLGAPTIMFYPSASNFLAGSYVSNPEMPAYYGIKMKFVPDFFGRVLYTLMVGGFKLFEKFYINSNHEKVLTKVLPNSPPISKLHNNVSLVFVNAHHSMELPRPYVPNMVQIGGFYAQSVKPLPEDLKKFLDSAKDGAILFSLGTNMKIENFDEGKLNAILKGLEKISPMKVLFKSEIELKNASKNVLVRNWIPQNDILAHPNIKAFISHGGLGGTTEAVYHGVPMLGIPLFADQKSNIQTAEDFGYAIPLLYDDITQDSFDKALKELLTNPKYTQTAKKRSSLLRNQPMNPLDKAIWWVEHIIEHKGGEHLRNIGMDLEWYQLYMVDIMLFYLALLCVIGIITFYVTRCILRRIYRRIFKKVKKE